MRARRGEESEKGRGERESDMQSFSSPRSPQNQRFSPDND